MGQGWIAGLLVGMAVGTAGASGVAVGMWLAAPPPQHVPPAPLQRVLPQIAVTTAEPHGITAVSRTVE